MRHIVAGVTGFLSTVLLIMVVEWFLRGKEYITGTITNGMAWGFALLALVGFAMASSMSTDKEM